jgi:hypothetical protein
MGDYFVTITDTEATPDEAEALGRQIVQWLIEREILTPDSNEDCVLGGVGYPPGPKAAQAVEHPENIGLFSVCGMKVNTGRSIQWTNDVAAWCPRCDSQQSGARFEDRWFLAAREWSDGEAGTIRCESCGVASPITSYRQGDFPWGFGNLSFEFWNWNILKDEFVQEIARRLGHNVTVSAGKF